MSAPLWSTFKVTNVLLSKTENEVVNTKNLGLSMNQSETIKLLRRYYDIDY